MFPVRTWRDLSL